MNKITLIRPEESINKSYSYPILINGEHVTDLSNNSEEVVTVDTDTISLQAQMGWTSSNRKEITFENSDHLKLRVTGNHFYNRVIRYLGGISFPLLAAIWILASHIPVINYGIPIFGTVLLLYLIYTLTIDKNNWLSITVANT